MDLNEPPVRREGGLERIGRVTEPTGEIPHQGRLFHWRGEGVPSGFGQNLAALVGVPAGDLGMRALHDKVM